MQCFPEILAELAAILADTLALIRVSGFMCGFTVTDQILCTENKEDMHVIGGIIFLLCSPVLRAKDSNEI